VVFALAATSKALSLGSGEQVMASLHGMIQPLERLKECMKRCLTLKKYQVVKN
jgi:hypothetical protein